VSRVTEWSDPPQMATGAPMPGIYAHDGDLYLAYIVNRARVADHEEFAVIKFSGVLHHSFGYPNDEALGGHPLYKLGLSFYAFNVVSDSPYIKELGERNARVFPGTESMFRSLSHWIVTFHDETLEVVADSAQVAGRVEARNAHSAIHGYLESVGVSDRVARRSFIED
jgi:hypothetical protein